MMSRSLAVRALATGFEQAPGAGTDEHRRARAAHLATEMLLAVDKPLGTAGLRLGRDGVLENGTRWRIT
jgi:hypothetical protein